jgi:hypothetical protein
MPSPEPAIPDLDAALADLERSAIGQTLQSAGAALTPAPAFAQRLEAQLRASAQSEPEPQRGAWSGLFASRSRRFVAAVVALLLLSGCGALALAASGQRVAGLPAPWPNTGATFSGSGVLLVVIAALGVFSGAVYWWLRQHGSFVLVGLEGVRMQNLKHFLWRTRSVSLTAVVVLTLTAVFWTLGAGASPFHDNTNQLPMITLQTNTGTDTTTTGTTATGTTTTGTTTTGTTTTGTTTTATTTTGTTTTGTTTTATTTAGTTTTSATTTGPGALPAQSNACDQKHPDQGNDTQGGQPGTPGHNNPRCFTTTTGATTAGSTSTATTTTTGGGALPAQSNACDDKHPDQGNDGNGHNNPHCASTTNSTSASTSATTGDQDQGDNDQGDQGNGDNNGDHGNGHGNGGNDNPAPAKPVPPSNGNGNGNGGNGGNNGGSHGGGNGGGKHK